MRLIFEIRVPTYNRPDLLRRALESLRAQTYPNWIAAVYDDAWAGEETVRAIADDRIRYRRNPQKLGACENIDKCFNPASVSDGTHGYVLEDHNFSLPGFFSLKRDEPTLRADDRRANRRVDVEKIPPLAPLHASGL